MRYFRVRIADETGAFVAGLTFTSVPGGTNPYICQAPEGAGTEVDVVRGQVTLGSYTVAIADPDTGGGTRPITSKLADTVGRYVLLGRAADLSTSTDGSAWTLRVSGYVEAVRFPSAIRAEIAIGDSLRVDRRRDVFKTITKSDGTPSIFDKATSIVGGPVRDGWPRVDTFNNGPWRMKVGAASGTTVRLDFMRGYVPVTTTIPFGAAYVSRTGAITSTDTAEIERRALPYRVERPGGWYYPGLQARLKEAASSTVVLTTPIAEVVNTLPAQFTRNGQIRVEWVGTLPSVNDEYDVHITPIQIGAENPLHIVGHPVDILTDLWDEAGIPWDSASATAVKAIIGPQTVLVLRIDESSKLADFQESVLFGPFRFGFRPGTNGDRVLFSTRRESSVPGTTVAIADVLGAAESQPVLFELDEGSIVRSVAVSQQLFSPWTQVNETARTPDTVLSQRQTVTVAQAGAVDGEDVTFDIPGFIGTLYTVVGYVNVGGVSLDAFTQALARAILPRFGFGCPAIELHVRDTIGTQAGEEVVLDLAHQINGNVRGGTRIVQVVKRTELLQGVGAMLRCLDGGLTSLVSTTPTFTLAANATNPRAFVDVVITNAATLAAAGNFVTMEWATGASSPATGSILTILNPALETSLTTPPVEVGSTVWVRMRSDHHEMRPSAWSAWQSVALTGLTAPSGLSQTSDVLTWTNGDPTFRTEVLWRLAAEAATENRLVTTMAAGATQKSLVGLVPASTSITVTIRHIDHAPFTGKSADVTLTYTTGGAGSLITPSSLTAQRLSEETMYDELEWSDGAGNPGGTTYHIEQSTTSGSSGFTEIASVIDEFAAPIEVSLDVDTWYRVRASKTGYTTTAYSNVALVDV